MIKLILFFLAFTFSLEGTSFPVAYQGRFRPMDVSSRLWLTKIYNKQAIKKDHETAFGTRDSSDFLWQLHFQGHEQWEDAPLFWIKSAELKRYLGLNLRQGHYSYNELKERLNNREIMEVIIPHFFYEAYHHPTNRSRSEKLELSQLSPGLWIVKRGEELVVAASQTPSFKIGTKFKESGKSPLIAEAYITLLNNIREFESLSSLKVIPSRNIPGEWLPLNTLGSEVNHSLYSDGLYEKMHLAYLQKSQEKLSQLFNEGYETIAGTTYAESVGKTLKYPTLAQLKVEEFYYRYPLTLLTILVYALALFLPKRNLPFLVVAFTLHTILLGLRCFILGRAPVSNMFETVVYVPWIAVLFSLFLNKRVIHLAAAAVAIALLTLLQVSQLGSGMENVQAVLDSQYWLIIHVLMVVGSYGLFALAGIMGHIYLIKKNPELAKSILQTIYIGTALLISGTILGGVWAAESWGRFWDWDPKESWAFISSCIYLIIIHLATFKHIGNFGLAVGSIVGLCAISFTWYGVNYILGTGLHSYGFGSGGELFYYLFLLGESLFIGSAFYAKKKLSLPIE